MNHQKAWNTVKKLVKKEIEKDKGELRGNGPGCAYILGMMDEAEELMKKGKK